MSELPAMRPNPLRATLDAGGTVYGTMAFEFFTPGLMAALQAAGADFVLLDTEHSGVGIETIKAQVAASRGLDIVPMARVPGCHYHLIAPVLDAGAMGIMVPMVETAEQARQIASWCRYPPDGRARLGLRHGARRLRGRRCRRRRCAPPTSARWSSRWSKPPRGIENVDAIMAVAGIDIGWLGHFDLTDQHGHSGTVRAPGFSARGRRRWSPPCRAIGKPAGFLAGSVEMARGVAGKGVPRDRLQHRYRPVAGFAARRAGEAACRRGVTRSRGTASACHCERSEAISWARVVC